MTLGLMDFAYSYITRSRPDRRCAAERDVASNWLTRYETAKGNSLEASHDRRSLTRIPQDNPGAREIGFAIPERYNASCILFDNLGSSNGADRMALTGPAGTRTYRELCTDAARWGLASIARAATWRPHTAVPRRQTELSGGVLRRGARELRAAADQYADAARAAAISTCRTWPARRSRWPVPSSVTRFNKEANNVRRCGR